ncbi:unnamed protein product, partial [Phaeothamnion confervicola]
PVEELLQPFVERFGLPTADSVILPYKEFTVCFDSRSRNPRWVLEKVVTGPSNRSEAAFHEESRLEPRFRSRLADFKHSGFDRGHLAPAG